MLQKLEQWLEPKSGTQKLIDPLFRVLTSLIFIIGGLGHLGQHQTMLDRMVESPWAPLVVKIGDPSIPLLLAGIAFVVAGSPIVLGWMTRVSALMLLFLVRWPGACALYRKGGS